MSDSLITQVKRLAEFQERVGVCPGWEKHQFSMLLGGTIYRGTIDFPALLAHIERTQAVVDTAREALWKIAVLRQGCKPPEDGGNEIAWDATGIARAALENLENTDGK